MNFTFTKVFEQTADAYYKGYRRILHEGGTGSSKTYSIIQFLILLAKNTQRPLLISIVSETLPHLKKGAMRDWKILMTDQWDDNKWNATDLIYTYGLGVIEFFSADQPGKQRGPRRQVLWINEPNNGVSYESYDNLDSRTELLTILDWNPTSEFWVHEKGLINHPENKYIHSTYIDALGVVPEAYVNNILEHKERDPNWWNIYGLGQLGKVEGLVYPFFNQVDELPKGDYFYGLDFGFTNDPAVLVKNVIIGANLYSQELIYETNLTNDVLSRRMDLVGVRRNYDVIYADAAEPKSIEELCNAGFNVKPSEKGQGSVEYGHQKVRQLTQHWTKNSLNCIKEQRNFRYIETKDGILTEKTTHLWSHGMDARRYAVASYIVPVKGSNVIHVGIPGVRQR